MANIRIDVELKKWNGKYCYILKKRIPAIKFLFFKKEEKWETISFTFDIKLASQWSKQYGIKIPTY